MTASESPDPIQLDALKRLGHRLRRAREDTQMNPEQAATASGIKRTTLLRYERGESEPGALKIVALAEAYGISGCHLLGLESPTDEPLAGQVVLDLDAVDAINNVTVY
jgi:transcriptional regulator with XRE-family HTH domain